MQKRILGKTGQAVSVVGFGGIIVTKETTADAARYVGAAIDRDVNYFDIAPTYGNAQQMLGPALEPYRNKVFLSCKTTERTKEGVASEMQQSLKLLRTDHFDLYQFHCVADMDDVEKITAPGGALEAVIEARKKGIVRYVGFSAHAEEPAIALLERFDFDTVMFPVNWACWLKGNFGPLLMEAAVKKGVGIIALKSLARSKKPKSGLTKWNKCWYLPVDSQDEVDLALRFTLSQPVTVAVSPGHYELLEMACDAAEDLKPLNDDEIQLLKERTEDIEPMFSCE